MKGLNKLSVAFAAGCVGGLLTSLLLYLCGALGLMASYGVKWSPALTADWLYQRTIWGGLFGLLFTLPWMDKVTWFLTGVIYSIVPTLAQLFVFFPLVTGEGVLGSSLGSNTPYFVILFNLVWGLITAFWIRVSR